MVNYTWDGSVSPLASNPANWIPNGSPTVGDTVIFDGMAVNNCEFDLATTVDNFTIQSDFQDSFFIIFTANVSVKFSMDIMRASVIDAASGTKIKFIDSPTVAFQHIVIDTSNLSPFVSETARNSLTFEFSYKQNLQNGIYPHMEMLAGMIPGFNPNSLNTTKEVKMLSLYYDGTTVVNLPTANDRLMKFIIEGDTRPAGGQSFAVNTANTYNFDAGYGEWTLQTQASGFSIPVAGSGFFGGWRFTWRNLVIAPSSTGTGVAGLQWGSILSLTNLTINSGVVFGGNASRGATIHCVNRPTIKGSWGFVQVADGIYHYKNNFRLNVAFGGTGLESVAQGRILFGYNETSLGTSSAFTFNTGTQSLNLGTGGLTFSDGTTQTTAATGGGGGGIGVNVQDEGVMLSTTGTTLNFVDGQHSVQTVPTAQPLCVEATGTGAVKTITIDGSKIRCNATDTLPTYLDAKLQTGANMSITLDTSAAASTGHAFTFAADNNKVKISSADTTENFLESKLIAGTGIGLTKLNVGGNETIEITSSSSAAGFMEKFKHDQTPGSGTPFSPFRILANNDTISTHDVNVFSPDTTAIGMMTITINSVGNPGNAGKEILFYGQDGVFNTHDNVIYSLDTLATDGVRSAFIGHMHNLEVGTGAPTVCFQSIVVKPMDANSHAPSVVRVIDTGIHSIIPAVLDINGGIVGTPPEDTPENVRILLVNGWNYVDDRGRFYPNFSFSSR